MSSIRWQQNDPNLYLSVNSRWYRFDTTVPPVGEGAMGIVYLGFDCDTNVKVAVKMLRQEFWGDPNIRNRFKLEGLIIMHHPHIVQMIGYCEDDSGTGPLFVLSEYVCGVTFKEHVQSQLSFLNSDSRVRYSKIVSEFQPVMSAVRHLHSYGVIHRDIKPMNLMFQDGYRLKLMDLGIAKADYFFDAHLKGFIGSKPFAAPEQIVEDNVEAVIDKRADIYSLGVTLSHLLVGHFPPQREDRLPQDLANVITKATMINPDDRYQTADEMERDVELYLSKLSKKRIKLNSEKVFILLFIIALLSFICLMFCKYILWM